MTRPLPLDLPLAEWTEDEIDRYFEGMIRWVMMGRKVKQPS